MKDAKTHLGPQVEDQPALTDSYFNLTKQIVQANGDVSVTYAVFMRRPVTLAPRLAIDWLMAMAKSRDADIEVDLLHKEGAWVGAGEPLLTITGSFAMLVDLETIFLQRQGRHVLPLIMPTRCVWNCLMLPFWRWMRGIALVKIWRI